MNTKALKPRVNTYWLGYYIYLLAKPGRSEIKEALYSEAPHGS